MSGKDVPALLQYLGLEETINLAKNAVPATRRVNSKPLTGDITLSAADVNAFALGMTGDYTLENDKSVGWNWNSGVYNVSTGGASKLILHFNMNIGSCPAVQFCVNYKNGGISYRSARDGFGFELDWTEFYTTTRKPSAGDVGALPVSGGVINGNLGIGTPNILGGSSIVLGDNDTGLKQNGDGVLDIYANSAHVLSFISSLVESMVSLKVNGNAVATGEVQAGNGSSRMTNNGDIFGSVWGNSWLSIWINNNFVADVQLGAGTSVATWNNAGSWPNTPGYVVTSVWKDNQGENIDGIAYAPLQKRVGNQWYTVQGGTA
ncbi:phage tail protein [Salmonella enterica subsp. enterica serovar Oslo]|nr:phage tail protein [Salmonella enterica subsp. enterica serovar Oslo]